MKRLTGAKAFTLIELMIVIAIAGIIVAWALPKFQGLDGPGCDNKKVRAKQDCDTLAQAIRKFNSFATAPARDIYMIELKEKYLKNIENLKDPWGNRYEQDSVTGMVYSKGPDGLHMPGGKKSLPCNMDDVEIYYKAVKNKSAETFCGPGRK